MICIRHRYLSYTSSSIFQRRQTSLPAITLQSLLLVAYRTVRQTQRLDLTVSTHYGLGSVRLVLVAVHCLHVSISSAIILGLQAELADEQCNMKILFTNSAARIKPKQFVGSHCNSFSHPQCQNCVNTCN